MTNELTDLTNIPAPTLTLDPVSDGEVAEASIVEVDTPAAPSLADSLSAEELAQVDAFAQQIDIANSQQVLTFGAGAQKKMASFSETALAKVRTQDLGEAGDLIAGVVTELKNFDVDDDDKGFFGLFKKSANKITSLKARYDTAEANVDKIAKTLEGHQVQLMKDAATLDKLYELNLTYFKELTMYLLAGRQRLAEVREGELAELSARAQASGSTEDAEAVQKLAAACNRFEKKLSDLDLSRTVAMQMAPQIRLVQNNEMLMIEKIQTTLVNTIPLWKSQMLLALGLAAAAWAATLFCGALALAGRPVPELPAVALAVLGIVAGSAGLYAIFLLVALKWGRNASIGLGALGFVGAMALMGGLANGLVTGTFAGALGARMAMAVPFAWPSRLASLPLEASIAAGLGADAQAQELVSAWAAVGLACLVATAVVVAVVLACANRFEGRRGGE